MSFRLLANRLYNNGRLIFHHHYTAFKRNLHTNILENQQQQNYRNNRRQTYKIVQSGSSSSSSSTSQKFRLAVAANSINRSGNFSNIQQHARRLFVDNILNRCITQYSVDLRAQARKKLFFGNSGPFFALVGVSLVSNDDDNNISGILTKEDQLECVCWEIREAAGKLQQTSVWDPNELKTIQDLHDQDFNIDRLEVGPPIAKGCAAVVYAATLKRQNQNNFDNDNINNNSRLQSENVNLILNNHYKSSNSQSHEVILPIQNISKFVHSLSSDNKIDSSNDSISFNRDISLYEILDHCSSNTIKTENVNDEEKNERDSRNYSNFQRFGNTSSRMIHSLTSERMTNISAITTTDDNLQKYPLALKMMFNYDIQSNAMAILRSMYKETLPARQRLLTNVNHENAIGISNWEQLIHEQTLTLPPHPNIVLMFGYFCDEVRNFRDGHLLYPIAQPQRINPDGYGRNMSLYLLMKRYNHSLQSYLRNDIIDDDDVNTEVNLRTRILLFAQLLEAIVHLNRYNIAHRDLKSDNILIDTCNSSSSPVLVLSDFGCCLADKMNGLKIPYTSNDIDKGGNTALMAPEIINTKPGNFSILNYTKSDLWAAGAIAYEIFGLANPFYQQQEQQQQQNYSKMNNNFYGDQHENTTKTSLQNTYYSVDDLPNLQQNIPVIIQELIFNILNPNPNRRLAPDIAANVLQIFLWAPSCWLKKGEKPTSSEILQWLLSLATKMMIEHKPHREKFGFPYDDTNSSNSSICNYTEYLLICSFLSRVQLNRIRNALTWIQSVL